MLITIKKEGDTFIVDVNKNKKELAISLKSEKDVKKEKNSTG